MDTPHMPKAIFGEDFQDVYEPAEDTFLLLDALEKELDQYKYNPIISLECGSGSGTVITALSKYLANFQPKYRLMLATDINLKACRTTKKCLNYHNQYHVQVIRTDLAETLVDRLRNQVDLLIFNPPYVPTEVDETATRGGNRLNLSWAGGEGGRQVIDVFLESYVPHLLSKPNGVAYLVVLEQNNLNDLLNYFASRYSILGTIVMHRRAGCELLNVIKYEWKEST